MIVYKITNLINNKIYIGFDTSTMSERWEYHVKHHKYKYNKKVLYLAMRKHGIENFTYEVIETATNITDLKAKEIENINRFNSINPAIGYNRTKGGDGGDTFTHRSLTEQQITTKKMSESQKKRWNSLTKKERLAITNPMNLGKWSNTTLAQRRENTSHLSDSDIINARSKSLKLFYVNNPNVVDDKRNCFRRWREQNKNKLIAQNRMSSAKAAEVNKIKVYTIDPSGTERIFDSKKDFIKMHGYIINRIIAKTKEGSAHKGWQGWEIE